MVANYYQILQVDPAAEPEVIEAAFKRLARKYHPDVYNGSDRAERMTSLNIAYETLSNRGRREMYNAMLLHTEAAGRRLPTQDVGAPSRASSLRPLIVSQDGRGDFYSIGTAIEAAHAGVTIYVRDGIYDETLVIRKPVSIIGDGTPRNVVVRSLDAPCAAVFSHSVLLARLTLSSSIYREAHGVTVFGNAGLTIEDCDISCIVGTCVTATGTDMEYSLRRCTIHDGSSFGVFCVDGCRVAVEACHIHSNHDGQVSAGQQSTVRLSKCTLSGGGGSSIGVTSGASVEVEDTQVASAMKSGIFVTDFGSVSLKRALVHGCMGHGISLGNRSEARITDSRIVNNRECGIFINTNSAVEATGASINGNLLAGIMALNASNAIIVRCDITANVQAPLDTDVTSEIKGHSNRLV